MHLVEAEFDACFVELVVVSNFCWSCFGSFDVSRGAQVPELFVQLLDFGIGWGVAQPNDEVGANESAGMVVAVEVENFAGGFLSIVGDLEQHIVSRRYETTLFHFLDELQPSLPVPAPGYFQQHNRSGLGFACLYQGEQLECLIQSAVAARKHYETVGFLDEHELASEEVLHGYELGVVNYELIGALLEGKTDVDAEGVFFASSLEPSGHDAGAGAGHHHPALVRKYAGSVLSLGVKRVGGQGPSRAEHCDLGRVLVLQEGMEGLTHLAQGGIGDLEVEAVGIIAC